MAIWVLAFGVAAVLVRVGLTLITAGSVSRPAAVVDVVQRAAIDVAVTTLVFWAVGAPLLLALSPVIGFNTSVLMTLPTDSDDRAAAEVYTWAVALIGGGVVASATAERAKRRVSLAASAVLGGIVLPVVGHWVWTGWLRDRNVVDFGGAMAVHLPAGVFAFLAAGLVGARRERYAAGPQASPIAPHSWPMVLAGVTVTCVGWLAYLMGGVAAHETAFNSTTAAGLAQTALNAVLAAVGGLLGGLLYAVVRRPRRGDRPAEFCGVVGLLGGLVAISAGCFAIGNFGAVLIGIGAGMAVPVAVAVLDRRVKLDDPAGLVSVFGVGSVWGIVAAALFAGNQAINRKTQGLLLANQALALAVAVVTAVVAAAVTFAVLRATGSLRAADEV